MQRTIAFLLSLLILLSSSGITYAQHYCGGQPVSSKVILGEEALSCGMVEMTKDTCHTETTIEKHSCCDDQYLSIDTDSHYNKAQFEFPFLNFDFMSTVCTLLPQEIITDTKKENVQVYRPPPLHKNLQILYETFLI